MKTTRISLCLGRTWVSASVEATQGWLRRTTHALHLPRLALAPEEPDLPRCLASAAAQLRDAGVELAGACLHVELGMDHARVGLMHLREGEGARLAPKALEAYIHGWMQQALHLEPADHVVRWQVLRDPHYVLASFVDGAVYTALLEFAGEHRLRFASCLPALLVPIRQARRGVTDTLVWTEGTAEHRDPCVQMLRFERGQLRASWRGWLPPGNASEAADHELESALQRFHAYSGSPADTPTARTHWPALPQPT